MIHDLIIWPNALVFAESIISDIRETFKVITIITIRWDRDKWDDNFDVFYSKSWQGLSPSKLQNAVKYKAIHCGYGDFVLIVFEDGAPEMIFEHTTEGTSLVNSHVFNKKKRYREITGGGHLVHTSNNTTETDRDLTLLLGMGIDDFRLSYERLMVGDKLIIRNCTGVDGYDSLNSFFYTLNHTINYCVLRNYECLPDHFFELGHEDIDLLVENLSHIIHLTAAKPISRSEKRVDFSIRIAGQDVQFDFRYLGDDYYDYAWEQNILKNRRMERSLFYVPSEEDLYYSLLYHAYIQKNEIKADYYPKLELYGSNAGIIFNPEPRESIRQLDGFLERYGYEYIKPVDKTVVYNLQNIQLSGYANRNGQCIRHTLSDGQNGFVYSSKVFEGDGFIKKTGTSWLIENEARFLERLEAWPYFPKILAKQPESDGMITLTISRLEGTEICSFFRRGSNQRPRTLRAVIAKLIDILQILRANRIEHRDMIPQNIIVNKNNGKVSVGLIDFGWSADIGDLNAKTPAHLGGRYAYGDNHSDYYATGVFLMEYWPDLPYVRLIASQLFNAVNGNTDVLLRRARNICKLPVDPYSRFRLFLRRHQLVSIVWHKFFK